MRTLAVIVVAAGILAGGCGDSGSDLPSLAAWTPAWQALRDSVPDVSAVEDGGVDVCGDFLGEVRSQRPELIPTPDESLEEPVTEWVSEAETVGLDCDREGDLEERLRDLGRRADEIDSRIDLLDE